MSPGRKIDTEVAVAGAFGTSKGQAGNGGLKRLVVQALTRLRGKRLNPGLNPCSHCTRRLNPSLVCSQVGSQDTD